MVEESVKGGREREPLRGLRPWPSGTAETDRRSTGGDRDGHPAIDLEQATAQLAEALVWGPGTGRLDAEQVLALAARAVPSARWSGITLLQAGRRPTSVAASGEVGAEVDALQHGLGEGPCIDAADTDDLVVVDDVSGDPRYPVFGPRCVHETGVRSILAVRIGLADDQGRAALNFYAERPDAFGALDTAVAAMFAPFVGLAVEARLQAQEAAHLQVALQSSRQIGSAVGILMANDRLTYDEAFALLVRASRSVNRKLRDIAEEVTRTGTLPE